MKGNVMNVQKFVNFLDSGEGDHSFYDPFVIDSAPIDDDIIWMIKAALETYAENRDDSGKPTGRALSASKYLVALRNNSVFIDEVIKAVKAEAVRAVDARRES